MEADRQGRLEAENIQRNRANQAQQQDNSCTLQ